MSGKYQGSCHCGAVRYECELDRDALTSKCNCSICMKSRLWKTIVKADAFRFLQGEDALTQYRFGAGQVQHLFCRVCGIKLGGRGHVEGFGDFVAVNVATLDNVSDAELASLPVQHEDGRNDRWDVQPPEYRYL